jgi:hypothetical protein
VHRFRAFLNVAVLVAASLMLAGPASAGGPTSALLSVPGEGKTASLYYTDPEYDALANLVGVNGGAGSGEVDRSGAGHETGPGVTVTWLIHDVTPWRVDHIYLEGKGAPWIATQVSNAEGTIWESPVVWHQPASPAELTALLDKLGVGEASRKAGDFSGVAGAPLPAAAEPTPAPSDPAGAAAFPFAGIWWGLGGLAAGVLLTRLWMRRSRADADPVREPVHEHAEAPGLVVAEELSWPAPRT